MNDKISENTQRICRVFVRLNEMIKMMMAELAIAKQGTNEFKRDEDFLIRAEAFAHVTAELLSSIFTGNGEDIKDIVAFMEECKSNQESEIKSHIDSFINMISNPN